MKRTRKKLLFLLLLTIFVILKSEEKNKIFPKVKLDKLEVIRPRLEDDEDSKGELFTKLYELEGVKPLPKEKLIPTGGVDWHSKIEFILKKRSAHKFIMYFKVYDEYKYFNTSNTVLSSRDKREAGLFSEQHNLDNHYGMNYIEMRDRRKFLYGKIISGDDSKIKLELYFIDKNNKEIKEVYIKDMREETIPKKSSYGIGDLIGIIDGDTTEGLYTIPFSYEEITIITRRKVLYKTPRYFNKEEKELYDLLMELFKKEIPKEYFEMLLKVEPLYDKYEM